jgi:hypothetical protein
MGGLFSLFTRGPQLCLSLLLLCCMARASSSFLQPTAALPLTPQKATSATMMTRRSSR